MDHQNSNGFHALHAACSTGSPDIVELLVRKKADVDCRNQTCQTPLIVAAENDQAEIIKHLLEVSIRKKVLGRGHIQYIHRTYDVRHVRI